MFFAKTAPAQTNEQLFQAFLQEKESILKRLDENERYITSLQEKIKQLINEKDALSGKVKSLEQEKELFKVKLKTNCSGPNAV